MQADKLDKRRKAEYQHFNIMTYTCEEYQQLIDSISSKAAYKKLRPGFISKTNLFRFGETGILVYKHKPKYTEFDLTVLFRNVLYRQDHERFWTPFRYIINGKFYFKDGSVRITKLEIESCAEQVKDKSYVKGEIRYDPPSGNSISEQEIFNRIETELNENYNSLDELEKTVFVLAGKEVLGIEVSRQLKGILNVIKDHGAKSAKRYRRIRTAEYLFGHWISVNSVDYNKKSVAVAAAFFNGVATYQLTQLYFEIIFLITNVLR